MADDTAKVGELKVAIDGINTRLSLMTGVFVASIALAIGAYAYLNNKVDTINAGVVDLRVAAAGQAEQIKGASIKLAEIGGGIQALPGKIAPQVPPLSPDEMKILMSTVAGPGDLIRLGGALSLYGLNPNQLAIALKTHQPPNNAEFAVTSINPSVITSFRDIIGGLAKEQTRLIFSGDQIYSLPIALEKVNIRANDNVLLLSSDDYYLNSLQTALVTTK